MEREKAANVVVDAVAFFKNVQLQDFAKNVVTVHSVVQEIRDAKTRERLAVLPYELQYREPSAASIQFVSEFARKAGEYGSLSPVDIQVMALAHQLTKEQVGIEHLREAPEKKMIFTSNKKPLENTTDIVGFYYPGKSDSSSLPTSDVTVNSGDVPLELSNLSIDEEKQTPVDETNKRGNPQTDSHQTARQEGADPEVRVPGTPKDESKAEDPGDETGSENADEVCESPERNLEGRGTLDTETGSDAVNAGEDVVLDDSGVGEDGVSGEMEEEEEETDDDDDVGWITPLNLKKAKAEMGKDIHDSLEGVKVACLTTDFAMQNCLIQIGIPVLSVEGMLIKKVKSYALRCFACFKVTSDTNRIFCPNCGNQTLNKVGVTVDDEGNTHYHVSRRRGYKVGELRQSIPLPKSGKHIQNPVVCEDQPRSQNRVSRKAMIRNNVFDPDYVAQNSPFVNRDVTSRSAILGVGRKQQNRRGRRK